MLGTIFSSGLIHIQCPSEYLGNRRSNVGLHKIILTSDSVKL